MCTLFFYSKFFYVSMCFKKYMLISSLNDIYK